MHDAMIARYLPLIPMNLPLSFVCLSVHTSVTHKLVFYYTKLWIMQKLLYDSPGTVFLMPKISKKFQRGHPQRGQKIIRDFRSTSRYYSETVQDGDIVTMEG